MFFGKRKGMIDIGKLQRKGIIQLPKEEPRGPETDNDGFVELNKTKEPSSSGFFSFMDKPSSSQSSSFGTESNGYNKKEVDAKVIDLDNKIYKLEQRIELLERKAGVGSGSSDSNPLGW